MLAENVAEVKGRQLQHMHATLKIRPGDILNVGLEGSHLGKATVVEIDKQLARLEIQWLTPPPPSLPLTLIIALPRPKMLKRMLQSITSMGVKQIYFINAWKVEKSYWQSPWLQTEKMRESCILGLEQARDTVIPNIYLKKLFKPFVEDELADIAQESLKLVCHPGVDATCPINADKQTTLVIGPEGGFTPYEIGKLEEIGFQSVHIGPRILRTETAVTAIISRLFCQT